MAQDDMELVRQYAARQSESAFEALVSRYTNLVYSAAFRRVGNSQQAEEITQAVFVILAQKAATLSEKTVLPGWLYRAACYVSGHAIKQELRRQRREQEAYMQTLSDEAGTEVWSQITPLLEDAMMRLGQADRDALVLRFFEGHSLKEVGAALGTSEAATKMRMCRALEKLRVHLARSGVHSTAETIAGAISANSVIVAPAMLAKTATAVALAKGATASISTSTLIKGALKIMAWSKVKTAIAAGAVILLAGGATTLVADKTIQRLREPSVDESFWTPQKFQKAPPVLIIRPAKSPAGISFTEAASSGKALELNTDLAGLLSIAFSIPPAHMVLPDNLPTNRFDLLLTLTGQPRIKLQEELQKRFGISARLESRDSDGLVLKIDHDHAPGLTPGKGRTRGSSMMMMTSFPVESGATPPTNVVTIQGGNLPPEEAGQLEQLRAANSGPGEYINMNNQTLADFAKYLEHRLNQEVFDQTGTSKRYDIKLHVLAQSDESPADALKRSILDQLGLELTPTNMPVDMLVVEKAQFLPVKN